MRCLVTGAAGMIGSHLVDQLLLRGYEVVGVDNLSFGSLNNLSIARDYTTFNFYKTDIDSGLSIPDVDIIFHLASLKKAPYGTVKLSDVMRTNSKMMESVLNFSNYKIPIIFSSTSDVYGSSLTFAEDEEIKIGSTTIPRFSYAMSKLHDEQLLLDLVAEGQQKAIIFRIFGCFSERSNRSWSGGHIPIFIDRALNDQNIFIYGDGKQTRSMSYVSDIVNGLMSVIDSVDSFNGQIFNIGATEEVSVYDSAVMITKICCSKSNIKFMDTKHIYGKYPEIMRRFANVQKSEKLLGYKTYLTLEDAVKMVVEKWA